MGVLGVFYQLISLLLMMSVGYISAKVGIITPEFRTKMSSLILNVACPCIIVSSVLDSDTGNGGMLISFACSLAYFAILVVGARILVSLIRMPKEDRGITQILLVFSNQAFMGIPVVQAFYGSEGVASLSMFILSFNLMFFTYGILMINGKESLTLKSLVNSGIISGLLALFFGLTGLHLPIPVETSLSSIGAVNTPLAMMVIGASLAHSDLKTAFSNVKIYKITACRLLFVPAIMMACMMGLMKIFHLDPMLAGISIILAGMPTAANCGMLSDLYRPDDMTASHTIILSTLISAITLPILSAAVSYLL